MLLPFTLLTLLHALLGLVSADHPSAVPITSTTHLVNTTIDDDDATGAIYSFRLGSENKVSNWQQCNDFKPGCVARPDKTRAHDGTWHEAIFEPEISGPTTLTLTFNGTAIYVYFILLNLVPWIPDYIVASSTTNLTFALDNTALPDTFLHTPNTASTDYVYDALVFHRTWDTQALHSLRIDTSYAYPWANATSVFDYAVYTSIEGDDHDQVDQDPESTKSNVSTKPMLPTAALLGLIFGILFLLLSVGLVIFFCLRRRKEAGAYYTDLNKQDMESVTPFLRINPYDQPTVLAPLQENSRVGSSGDNYNSNTGLMQNMPSAPVQVQPVAIASTLNVASSSSSSSAAAVLPVPAVVRTKASERLEDLRMRESANATSEYPAVGHDHGYSPSIEEEGLLLKMENGLEADASELPPPEYDEDGGRVV